MLLMLVKHIVTSQKSLVNHKLLMTWSQTSEERDRETSQKSTDILSPIKFLFMNPVQNLALGEQ